MTATFQRHMLYFASGSQPCGELHHVSSKLWHALKRQHGVITQTTIIRIHTAKKTLNLTIISHTGGRIGRGSTVLISSAFNHKCFVKEIWMLVINHVMFYFTYFIAHCLYITSSNRHAMTLLTLNKYVSFINSQKSDMGTNWCLCPATWA